MTPAKEWSCAVVGGVIKVAWNKKLRSALVRAGARSRSGRGAVTLAAAAQSAAVMGGEPPTPSHVSIRTRLPTIPPFLFPLPQCSYVSFPLYFLWPSAAAVRHSALSLMLTWDIAILVARGAEWGGRGMSAAGGVRSLRVDSTAATVARVSPFPAYRWHRVYIARSVSWPHCEVNKWS